MTDRPNPETPASSSPRTTEPDPADLVGAAPQAPQRVDETHGQDGVLDAGTYDAVREPRSANRLPLGDGTWHQISPKYVRVQFIASDPRQDGTWSSWISVTTADVRTTLPDLATEVSAQISDMAASIRSLIADAQALAAVTAGSMLADYSDRQMIRTELVSTKNDVTARYTEAIIAATGPGSALVARVTSLESTVNNPSTGVSATATALSALTTRVTTTESGITTNASAITALQSQMGNTGSSAVFAIQTGYTPAAGWTSKIGIVAAVSAGGTMYAAGLYFEAKTGSSRIVAAASQFVFATSAGNPIALIDGTTGVFGDSAGKVALNMYTGAFSITV